MSTKAVKISRKEFNDEFDNVLFELLRFVGIQSATVVSENTNHGMTKK
jgi:hypothetical protein